MTTKRATFNTYFPTDPEQVGNALEIMAGHLARIRFDTFVVTGISGLSFGALAARKMDKHLFVIRKDGEYSHEEQRPVGTMGSRWIFLDDFVSTGSTFKKVKAAVEKVPYDYAYMFGGGRHTWNEQSQTYDREGPLWTPTFAGVYEYKHDRFTRHAAFLEALSRKSGW